ncbi:MAG: hypothetical protein AB7O62_04435 [Pirellulales bacterium]
MLELHEDSFGDIRNARFLGVAAGLAYLPQDEGKAAYKKELGLDAKLISVDNTQAYIAQNPDHVVLAFRGTETGLAFDALKDCLLTDAVNLLIVPKGRLGTDFIAAGVGARFHQGFINALAEIWDPVFAGVQAELKRSDRPLWITGHSLGGALAALSAWLFQRKFVSVHQVYTFGAPMIGNVAASKAFDVELKGKIYRVVNGSDPVPKLPTISLIANDYGHVDKEIALGVGPGASSSAEMFGQFAKRTINGMLEGNKINEFWKHLQSVVSSHFMDNYRKLLDDEK